MRRIGLSCFVVTCVLWMTPPDEFAPSQNAMIPVAAPPQPVLLGFGCGGLFRAMRRTST